MDVYVNGEPAGTWGTATGNTVTTYHEVDVTGIDDLDELEDYFEEKGIIPYEMVNGKKVYVTFAKLPQNNTAVSVSAINDLIAISGGSMLAGYNTSGMIAKLSKSLVFNAIMRTMFLVIEGNTVQESVISQLENVLNPFCISGTNDIPIYVDSDGVAHVWSGAVEAVRNKLIELGAYQAGGFTPASSLTADATVITTTYNQQPSTLSILASEFNSLNMEYVRYLPNCRLIVSRSVPVYLDRLTYEYVDGVSSSGEIDISSSNYVVMFGSSVKIAIIVLSSSTTPKRYGTCKIFGHRVSDDVEIQVATASNYDVVKYEVTYNGNTYTVVGIDIQSAIRQSELSTTAQLNNVPYLTVTETVRNQDVITSLACGTAITPLQGVTPSASIPVGFGDITLPLPDVWPDWYAKKKQVATPADDDLYLRSPALPLDVPVDNVFDDGYAGDSEDATAGDLEDILKNLIIGVLPDILADIINDTDVTADDVYRIPVDDGGDTPPATPPVLDGSSNGLWTMYNPDKQDVNDFGAWLWSDTIIDQIIRQFNSPIDAIIGFHQIYCTPVTGADKVIKAGFLNSPVSAPEVTNQYVDIDCGTVHVDEFYGNVLDYDNSQVSIYLPFVGIVPLNTNLVMGADLNVIYRIDVFTGTCLAQIKVIRENSNAVLYAFEGNCAVQIPLTATTYTGMIGALISGISAGVSFAEGDMLHATTSGLSAVMSAMSGRSGAKQSGAMGSNAGSLGIRKPYIIITRAISSMPAGFETLSGLPSTELTALSSVSGFTVVRNVHLEGIPGTAEELEEIKALLESGVIF